MGGSRAVRVRVLAVAVGIVALLFVALQLKPQTAAAPTSSPGGSGVHGTSPASTSRPPGPSTPSSPRPPIPSGPLPSAPPTFGGDWATTNIDIQIHDLIPTPRGLLAIGDDRRGGAVWISPTGVDWTVDDDSVVFDRAHLRAGAANALMTILVGCTMANHACARPSVWLWTAAAGWSLADATPFGSATIDDVVATAAGFLAISGVGTYVPRLWTSTNGSTWTVVKWPASRFETVVSIAASADAFLVAGNDRSEALAWVSSDGHSWTESVVAKAGAIAAAAESFAGGFAVAGSTLIQAATADVPEQRAPAVWTSLDSSTWAAAKISDDGGGPLFRLTAGPDGLIAYRQCCGSWLIAPEGRVTWINIPDVDLLVDGPAGLIGIYAASFVTNPAVTLHPPLSPVPDLGQGYAPTPDLPASQAMTGTADSKGRLYVFSAVGSVGTLRVDRLDPSTNKWTRLRDVAAGIRDAKAVVAADGIMYLVGVTPDGKHGRTIEYNPAKQTWRVRAPMPTPRTGFGIAIPTNGAIYVFGGTRSPCCGSGTGALDVVERYDPRTDHWARLGPMPLPAAAVGAVSAAAPESTSSVVNASIQLAAVDGGGGALLPGPVIDVFLDARVWIFDPASTTWTAGPANLSFGVNGSPVVGIDGIVRVFNCDRYDLYDPFMNHWQVGQALDQGRCSAIAVASNSGFVYVFGGDYLPSPGRSVSAFFAGGG